MRKYHAMLLALILAIVFIIGALLFYYNYYVPSHISSFEECRAAGYPVLQSFPRQCSANGNTFSEVIANATYCTSASRDAEACILMYEPVCGWTANGSMTFSNSCVVCTNEHVLYWTPDSCQYYISSSTGIPSR